MRRTILIIAGVLVLAGFLLCTHRSRSLTVESLGPSDLVSSGFPGSNYQSVAAVVRMQNRTSRPLYYSGFYRDHALPDFKCYYFLNGRWYEGPNVAFIRAFQECNFRLGPQGLAGGAWSPAALEPSAAISFRADILIPQMPCKIAVACSAPSRYQWFYQKLPSWLVQRLPWARGTFELQTSVIPNGSKS